MTDFASLAIKIDSSQAAGAAGDLDKLTAAGARAESAAQQTGRGWLDASSAVSAARTQVTGLGAGLDMQARSAASMINAGRAVTVSAGQQRAGMQQLSYQIGDVAQQFALGVNPMVIFAQQGGQVIQAITMMRGTAGGLIGFLGGPWGAVITGAAIIAGTLGAKLFDAGEEAKTAGEKFEVAAGQARALAGAMNSLALAKRQIALNEKRDRALELETALDKGPTAWDRYVSGPTVYQRKRAEQQRELSGLRLDIAGEENVIRLAEQQTAAMDKETVATKRAAGAHRERQGAMSEAQRAYETALKSTDRYIESLALEIDKIGKTPAQIRQIEIARAREGAATEAQRIAIDKLNVAREHALGIEKLTKDYQAGLDWDRTVLAPLEREVQLVGLSGSAREAASLALEKEAFMADLAAKGIGDLSDRWDKYYQARMGKAQAEEGAQRETERVNEVSGALERLQAQADSLNFADAFGQGGEAIDGMVAALRELEKAQQDYNVAREKGTAADKEKASAAYTDAKLKGTIGLISASKRLFNEQSAGYKALEAAERAMMAVELVSTAIHVAKGAAKIFSSLGPFGFPVAAAMLGVMAGLGFKGGGSSGPAPLSAQQQQDAQGTGTVLGDPTAKSASIANSLQLMADNTNKQLEYSNAMVGSLRKIERGITALASALARQLSLSGGAFDTSGFRLGQSGSAGVLGLFASSTTRTLYDQGINIFSTSLASALANGISGQTYNIVEQVKKSSGFFGIGGGTKTTYETYTSALDSEVTRQIQLILGDLKNTTVQAAKIIGFDVSKMLDNFQVEIGKISLQGLKGSEITDALSAVFSKVADQMAGFAVAGLEQFQKVGEGLFETLSRVAKNYMTVDVSLKSIGRTFGAIGSASVAAREGLVGMFESLDDFASATEFYRSNFLTEAEQIAPVISSVADEMVRLGLASVDTLGEFKSVVNGLDLTTTAGQQTYAALMSVAPAFSAVIKYQDKLAKSYDDQATSLRAYLSDLLGSGTASSLATAAARFRGTATSALLGDLDAMGALKGVANTYLEAAKNNARSPLDYARARAEVLRTVSQTASAADEQAAMQRKQLAVAEETAAAIAGMRSDLTELQIQTVANTNTIATVLQAASDGDSLRVSNDADNPLSASVAA